MSIAQEILKSLEKQSRDGLTIEQAKNTAYCSALPYYKDISAISEDNMFSYTYTYDDESKLIIDDEGYAYCSEDDEITILCNVKA